MGLGGPFVRQLLNYSRKISSMFSEKIWHAGDAEKLSYCKNQPNWTYMDRYIDIEATHRAYQMHHSPLWVKYNFVYCGYCEGYF